MADLGSGRLTWPTEEVDCNPNHFMTA